MMLNEDHQNLACEFAEELVSYLYDELNGDEKSGFETHLKTCAVCPDEIAGFGAVRNSIADWREIEFSPLSTPVIEIPPVETIESPSVKATPVSRPWFEAVREFFTLSPAWMTATTAFAALAICIALGFVLLNSLPDSNQVIVQEDKTKKAVPSPTTDVNKQNATNSEVTQPDSKESKSPVPNFSKDGLSNPEPQPIPVKAGVRNTTKPQNLKKTDSSTVENKANKQTPKSVNKGKPPSLIGEEEEEKTIRLTDLLEEIGMRD